MDGHQIIMFLGMALAAAVCTWFVRRAERRRRQELAAFASEIGWCFSHRTEWSENADFAPFDIFRRGRDRIALNTLEGEVQVGGRTYACTMGDYRYTVTRGKTEHTQTFSYIIATLPFGGHELSSGGWLPSGGGGPVLLIRREGLMDKLAGAFGFADINFESAEFSGRYHVRSPDRKFAYDLLDARMIEFILKTNPPTILIEHGFCCISDGGTQWTLAQYRAMHRWVQAFFERWPRHVQAALDAA